MTAAKKKELRDRIRKNEEEADSKPKQTQPRNMKIRDGHATLNGDTTEHEMPSGSLDIIADDGRALFMIGLNKDGSLDVRCGHFCKHGGTIYEDTIVIRPKAANCFDVVRIEYKQPTEP